MTCQILEIRKSREMFKINYQNKSGFLAETHKTMGESRNNNEKKNVSNFPSLKELN